MHEDPEARVGARLTSTPTRVSLRVPAQEVQMQQSAEKTTSTKRLSSAEREWIRRQGRVSRAIEASQRRSSGRFSRVAKAPGSRLTEPTSGPAT